MNEQYPERALIPTDETRATQFVQLHPEADGRGIIVGILDTGVDPGAPGLSETSTGAPRLVDSYDCTGSGDVTMEAAGASAVATADDGTVTVKGLTGTSLVVPAWVGTASKVWLGTKKGYELFPDPLVRRVKRERKKNFEREHNALVAAASAGAAGAESTLHTLLQKHYVDQGPVYDVVAAVNADGVVVVGVDAELTGDLSEDRLWLTSYRLAPGVFGTFTVEDALLNFVVNVFESEDGAPTVSLVVDAGSHGTHVAGIVSGVAPGAQLISFRIGEGLLGSMETATAITRALYAAVSCGCHVINMSYGESISKANAGRIAELATRLVDEHGIAFVSSAGNEGPGLSTLGAPGGTMAGLIGVGAYVSPAMMQADHSLRERVPETAYTWSSRGPTYDGDLGVSVTCPGGAIAPVPNWTQNAKQMMNGTSMSSPSCAGCCALVLSGLLADGLLDHASPAMLKRALENSARAVPGIDNFVQGHGLVQVDACFDLLRAWCEEAAAAPDALSPHAIRYGISIGAAKARGVYLRDLHEVAQPSTHTVTISPVVREGVSSEARVGFVLPVSVVCAEAWVETPSHVMLMHGGRSIQIRVDPTALRPGAVYSTEILGYASPSSDAAGVGGVGGGIGGGVGGGAATGPLFRIPVTVVVPTVPEVPLQVVSEAITFAPNSVERRFVSVPQGATWMTVTVRVPHLEEVDSRIFFLHCIQLLPDHRYNARQHDKVMRLKDHTETQISFRVHPGHTVELTLAQYWSMLGATQAELSYQWAGVVVDNAETVFLHGSSGQRAVEVTNLLHPQTLAPKASLTHLRKTLTPATKGAIRSLHPTRYLDTVSADGRIIHELTLTYKLKLVRATTVRARQELVCDALYEGPFEGQLLVFYDGNQNIVGASDAWPRDVSLPEGEITLKLHVRHPDPTVLARLTAVPIHVEFKLTAPVALPIHSTPAGSVVGGKPVSSALLQSGERKPLYLSAPCADGNSAIKDPAVAPGDVLLGFLDLCSVPGKASRGKPKSRDPQHIAYLVPPKAPTEQAPEDKALEAQAGAGAGAGDGQGEAAPVDHAAALAEVLRDASVKHLQALPKDEAGQAAYEELFARLSHDHGAHVPLFAGHVKRLAETVPSAADAGDHQMRRRLALTQVIGQADLAISLIDQAALAQHFGLRINKDDKKVAEAHKKQEELKKTLIELLQTKATAYLDMVLLHHHADTAGAGVGAADGAGAGAEHHISHASEEFKGFEATYAELAKWTDMETAVEGPALKLRVKYHLLNSKPEKATKAIAEALAKEHPQTKATLELAASVMMHVGWAVWQQHFAERVVYNSLS